MSEQEEADLGSDVSVDFVLLNRSSDGDEEEQEPGETDFKEHLQVDDSEDSGVELGSHEEVVDEVSSHSVLSTTSKSRVVGDEGYNDSGENSDGHVFTKVVDEVGNLEDSGDVESKGGKDGYPEGPERVTEVVETDVVAVGDGVSLGPDSGEYDVQNALVCEEGPVDEPGFEGGEGALWLLARLLARLTRLLASPEAQLHGGTYKSRLDVEVLYEVYDRLPSFRQGELRVVVCLSNPHVPHEKGETQHDH